MISMCPFFLWSMTLCLCMPVFNCVNIPYFFHVTHVVTNNVLAIFCFWIQQEICALFSPQFF